MTGVESRVPTQPEAQGFANVDLIIGGELHRVQHPAIALTRENRYGKPTGGTTKAMLDALEASGGAPVQIKAVVTVRSATPASTITANDLEIINLDDPAADAEG